MDNTCIKAIISLTLGFLGLTAMFLGYKIKADKKSVELEKNDNNHQKRIKELEKKNGTEQRQINELKEEIKELKEKINGK